MVFFAGLFVMIGLLKVAHEMRRFTNVVALLGKQFAEGEESNEGQ